MKNTILFIALLMVLVVVESCKKEITEPVGTTTCATPTFAPGAGVFTSVQRVSITCVTSGATIRYTTDGSDPVITSTLYSSPITISATTTIKAKAFKTDLTDSSSTTALYTINITPAEMVLVPAGTITMGDTRGGNHSAELPTHMVTLSSFYMGKYEVTQGEYQAIMGSNPVHENGVGANYPVSNVSWYSAVKYCNLRSMNEGLNPVYSICGSTDPSFWGEAPDWTTNAAWDAAICNWTANGYRLPTEAEWEYAARGGTNTPDYLYSGSDDINAVAWYTDNSSTTSHIVGTKAANNFGIYDMSGNEFEWCWDWYGSYNSDSVNNPTGASSGFSRLTRGGVWSWYDYWCRVSSRLGNDPSYANGGDGFRLCRAAN